MCSSGFWYKGTGAKKLEGVVWGDRWEGEKKGKKKERKVGKLFCAPLLVSLKLECTGLNVVIQRLKQRCTTTQFKVIVSILHLFKMEYCYFLLSIMKLTFDKLFETSVLVFGQYTVGSKTGDKGKHTLAFRTLTV